MRKSFDEIIRLRANNPAWRLLRADNAPHILGFLSRIFVEDNVRSISMTGLVGRRDDELFALNERDQRFRKPVGRTWTTAPGVGWLGKDYPKVSASRPASPFSQAPGLARIRCSPRGAGGPAAGGMPRASARARYLPG